VETPGHTVESISVLVTDLDRGPEPFAVLTGDTLFIGDVGRPDLSADHTPQQLAGMLYDSLHEKLLPLGDAIAVYPAHGAGSLCGRQIGSEKSSTIGRERASNYALQVKSREEFVRLLTAELPERPGYFERDVEINRSGAPPIAQLPPLAVLTAAYVERLAARGAVIVDTRTAPQFGAGHVPGSVNIGLSGQYASWAARILGLDTDVVLIAEDEARLEESRLRLARVGLERVVGSLADGLIGWTRAGKVLEQLPQISVQDLARLLRYTCRSIVWGAAHSSWTASVQSLSTARAATAAQSPLVCSSGPDIGTS
jgi:rhodanese-related sulfurtransferase